MNQILNQVNRNTLDSELKTSNKDENNNPTTNSKNLTDQSETRIMQSVIGEILKQLKADRDSNDSRVVTEKKPTIPDEKHDLRDAITNLEEKCANLGLHDVRIFIKNMKNLSFNESVIVLEMSCGEEYERDKEETEFEKMSTFELKKRFEEKSYAQLFKKC